MRKYIKDGCSGMSGVSILWVTQIVLIILKLVGTIDWAWTLVLIPLWIDLGLTVFVLLLWLLVVVFKAWRKK